MKWLLDMLKNISNPHIQLLEMFTIKYLEETDLEEKEKIAAVINTAITEMNKVTKICLDAYIEALYK